MPSPVPTLDRTTRRSRQRFARRQWARRWLAWKYVVAVVLLVALVIGGIWTVFYSSVLAVERVDVTGIESLTVSQVRERAAVPEGRPLARLDLEAFELRVESLEEVKSADVTRKWPNGVLIEIEERVAIAVVEIGGQLRGMDASGELFLHYRRAPAGLPLVVTSSSTDAEARQEAAEVIVALPTTLATRVDHLEVVSVDQISLVLRDGRLVVWGSAAQSDEKARVLEALLSQDARVYDVSVPGQPTTSG